MTDEHLSYTSPPHPIYLVFHHRLADSLAIIIEYPELEETHKAHQMPALHKTAPVITPRA